MCSYCRRFCPQPQDLQGSRLLQLAADMGLMIPQTFRAAASDPDSPQWTWTSKLAGHHRIDYVAVPLADPALTPFTIVRDPMLSGGNVDHAMVLVGASILMQEAGDAVRRRMPNA